MSDKKDDPVNNLASSLSRTSLTDGLNDHEPALPRNSHFGKFVSSLKLEWDCEVIERDGLAHAVRKLRVELDGSYQDERIDLDERCIEWIKDFIGRWNIPELAMKNCLELARGNPAFPVVILLNPSNESECLPFPDMVEKSPTLSWIQDTLSAMGLSISDVGIWDTCPLLCDNRLKAIAPADKATAMDEAYDLTEKVLYRLQPGILLSCQCSTATFKWSQKKNSVADGLCSSVRGAESADVGLFSIGTQSFAVAQAFHPMHVLRQEEPSIKDEKDKLLKRTFRRLYSSCAVRKAQVTLLMGALKVVESVNSFMECFARFNRLLEEASEMDAGAIVKRQLGKELKRFWDEVNAAQDAYRTNLEGLRRDVRGTKSAIRQTVAKLLRQVWSEKEVSKRFETVTKLLGEVRSKTEMSKRIQGNL